MKRTLMAVVLVAAFAPELVTACAPAQLPSGTVPDALTDDCNVLARRACEGPSCIDAASALSARPVEHRRGRVSYYADFFAGRRTANGERYDPGDLTAASPNLPFGTIVRVRRREGGRTVVVRVNDRGPSRRGGRIFDLSKAAARCLDMLRAGVVEVDADVLELGPRGRRN